MTVGSDTSRYSHKKRHKLSQKQLDHLAKLHKIRRERKPPTMTLPGELTERQKNMVINIASGMDMKSACIEAGFSPNSAETYCPSLLKKPEIQESLQALMDKAGLSTMELLSVHKDMIHATKPISVVTGKDADSRSMDFIEVPDWSARGSGLNMAYKLKGLYADQNLNITAETHEQRMARLLGAKADEG